ncbi:tail needle knob protein, partial [Escherichia coli]|uniref:tail needle knob protein n=1 Tax=Escherichia coli TaxID=562 RepID=UPI002077942E
GTDVGNVANKANEAGQGAYDAQVRNDEQDVTLADHESRIEAAEATLINHEHRIAAAESTLADHETRITAAETELADHETRIAANESELANHDARITQNTTDIDALDTRLTAAEGSISTLQSTVGDHSTRISALEYATTRKKSEVVYSGVSVTIPTAPTNLVSLLKTFTPSSGTLAPFFDTVNNKMVVFNENKTLFFKLSIVGTWPSGTANRSMQLTFSGSVPDTLVSSRNAATATDNILLATFFSVDKDGFLATNGSTLTI